MRLHFALRFAVLIAILSSVTFAHAQNLSPKLEIHGLIDMGDISFNHTPGLTPNNTMTAIEQAPAGIFRGKMVNVLWAQLQPTNANSFDFSAIDSALSGVEAYNAQHPETPIQAILRVWSGPNSPDWVKHLGGDPVTVIHKAPSWQTGITETVGRFWSKAYRQAWQNMQTKLAAKYDDLPLISLVVVTSCSSTTDETFIMALDQQSRANVRAAGFTDEQYRDCVLHPADDYVAWRHTPLEFTFNPYWTIMSKFPVADPAVTIQAMQSCRDALGSRCVISTYCIGTCETLPAYTTIFERIKALGAPISFEPFSPTTLSGDMSQADATVDRAIGFGASSLEIWPLKDGFASIPAAHLQMWAAKFPSISAATPQADK